MTPLMHFAIIWQVSKGSWDEVRRGLVASMANRMSFMWMGRNGIVDRPIDMLI